jgi:hypothetical protein
MDEIISMFGGLTITNPKMQCPVHGVLENGWVQFTIGQGLSPNYCLRCAMEVFAKQGISVVTPVDAGTAK